MKLYLTGTSILSPLETPGGLSTFDAIRAGHRLADRGIVDPALLASADPEIDKSLRMALVVARRAVAAAGWTAALCKDEQTALFAGTSKGPVISALAAMDQLRAGQTLSPALARQIALGPDSISGVVAEDLAIGGPRHTSVAACSSGMHALHRAARALAHDECRRALVVAADASIHALFEGSFDRLGVLAKPQADGRRRCRPFDDSGAGFFLCEAAAAVVLEMQPRPGCIALERTWIGGDGTHLLAVDERTHALHAGFNQCAGPFSFIHAHATGTAHDGHERAALQGHYPGVPMFSHKGWLGHSLGAAGLVGLVLSAQCHAARVTLMGDPLPFPARSLTLSQGFGGHIAMAVLSG